MFNLFNKQTVLKSNDTESLVDILFITYNRLNYTKETLPALLSCSDKTSFRVTVVDNASTDGTVEYLKELKHENLREIIFNSKNTGLVKPTKSFWKRSNATYVGKIDNDILVEKGWIEPFLEAHQKVENLGIIGCSHFRRDDYNEELVAQKVSTVNGINIRTQGWIGGNYLARKATLLRNKGYTQSRRGLKKRILHGFTKYQSILKERGYINGYLANNEKRLYHWTHFDDPREPQFNADSDHLKIRALDPDQIIAWYKKDAKNLLEEYEA